MPLSAWLESGSLSTGGMAALLSKIHGCINQLEQFPVRVHDLPGRRSMPHACMHMYMHVYVLYCIPSSCHNSQVHSYTHKHIHTAFMHIHVTCMCCTVHACVLQYMHATY